MTRTSTSRAARWLRAAARFLRRNWLPFVVVVVSLYLLSRDFFSHDYTHDLEAPRGQGIYRPFVAVSDGHKLYLSLRSFVLDRDLDVRNDIKRFGYDGGIRRTADGRPYFPQSFGPVLVWSPFFVAAHGASKIANLFGADIPGHGYTHFHQRFVLFTSILFAIVACLLGAAMVRKWLRRPFAATLAMTAILFGTSLTYYATFQTSYSHAMSAAASALFLFLWSRSYGRLDWWRFVGLGIVLGVVGMIRMSDFFLGIVVAIELVHRLAKPHHGDPQRKQLALDLLARGTFCLGVAVVAFVPQFLAWKAQTGNYLASPNGPGYVSLSKPMMAELMYASLNGLFSSHPLTYLGALGLLAAPRRARPIAIALFVALLLQLYVNSCVYDWWAMGSFGARRLCNMTAVFVFGLACGFCGAARLLSWITRRRQRVARWIGRPIAIAICAWFVLWNHSFADRYLRRKIEKVRPHRSCCAQAPEWMQSIAQPIYDRIGNPFAFPANALFARRYGVEPWRWDQVVGSYAARPRFVNLKSGAYIDFTHTWNVPGVHFKRFLIEGFGPRQHVAGRNYRWTTAERASFFMPLFIKAPHSVAFWVVTNTARGDPPQPFTVHFNGEQVAAMEGNGPVLVHFTLPAEMVNRGTNVVEIRSPLRDYRPARERVDLAPHPRRKKVGIAVRQLDIKLLGSDR